MSSFEIPFRLPSLNDYINACRQNKYAGAKFKNDIEEQICIYIKSALNRGDLKPITEPVNLSIMWTEPNAKRDVDNIQSGQKYILDALQKMKVLTNDSQRYVKQINHRVTVDKNKEKVEVRIVKALGKDK